MKYSDWNDAGIPLAHLFTFRCYGTWLHGDKRGSIDKFNNKFDTPYLPPNVGWYDHASKILKHKPVRLSSVMRKCVDNSLREKCKIKGWEVYAINARTNHVHSVVSVGSYSSKRALIAFKANATKKMRDEKLWKFDYSPWSENGSRKFLWNEKSLELAIDYVNHCQGKPLPDFF